MQDYKSIYDPIHGFVKITPLMQKIIDTSEFQRLRDLKQLGATYYVYPSATHTRFEHSIGVSHLAEIMIKSLRENQPELRITDRDIELTRIAALIHDIGHGPFSHLYDHYIIEPGQPEHEERGINIFTDMVVKYRLPIKKDEIKEIINMINPLDKDINKWKYQIVANKQSQIDVDKIDYIQRDCYHIGMKFGGEYSRLLTEVRVCKTTLGTLELAWPDKLQFEISSLFTIRYRLHKQVYNHHTVKAYEYLIIDILKQIYKTNPDFLVLTDSIITSRYNRIGSDIKERIYSRNIPKLISEDITRINKIDKIKLGMSYDKDIICDIIKIGFVSGDKRNPLESVLYFKKNKLISDILPYTQTSVILPQDYQEIITRFYKK